MGGDALLNELAELFLAERANGLYVDCVGLVSAYGGMVGESYILGVSAPNLGRGNCSDKTDTIIDVLFDKLPASQRAMIDRVRVYDSADELRLHERCNFDDSYHGYCEAPFGSTSRVKVLAWETVIIFKSKKLFTLLGSFFVGVCRPCTES